ALLFDKPRIINNRTVAKCYVPPATALLLSRRLPVVLLIASAIAIVSAVVGHAAALIVPGWLGFKSTTTSGMMAFVAGLIFLLAWLLSPDQGQIVRWRQRRANRAASLSPEAFDEVRSR
ncbi:MAG: hypothetical protein AAF236_10155, partial [Verrucomicrobiota bacterium]